jgi:glycolate oxidase FAD binding subunit
MTIFRPTASADVLDIVRDALSAGTPLEIVGQGTKRDIRRPVQAARTLDLTHLSGVTLYEPAELVLSARAGTPLGEIDAALAAHNQELAFEPMDYGPLFGLAPGRGTIGGALAANLSGPRRIKAGAARDHVLGVSAVSGRGEAFKAGGRVVKNVTGYDLSKGLAGSWGTLAVVTDCTFKVLPRGETEATLVLHGLSDEAAAAVMALALGSPADLSGAAHLPAGMASRVSGKFSVAPATLLRLEGFGPSVAARLHALKALFAKTAPHDVLERDASRAAWKFVRDCLPFADGTERPVWRVSAAPSEGWKVVEALRQDASVDAFYDWAGGLVWLRMEAEPQAGRLRRLLTRFGGGHATLVRATPDIRAATAVFEPQPPALAALSQRLKQQFDPRGVLNPGRMG